QSIAQDYFVFVPWLVLFGGERASQDRQNAQRRKKLRRGSIAVQESGIAHVVEIEGIALERAHRLERVCVLRQHSKLFLAPREIFRADIHSRGRNQLRQYNPVSLWKWKWLQQNSAHQTKNGSARTDT